MLSVWMLAVSLLALLASLWCTWHFRRRWKERCRNNESWGPELSYARDVARSRYSLARFLAIASAVHLGLMAGQFPSTLPLEGFMIEAAVFALAGIIFAIVGIGESPFNKNVP